MSKKIKNIEPLEGAISVGAVLANSGVVTQYKTIDVPKIKTYSDPSAPKMMRLYRRAVIGGLLTGVILAMLIIYLIVFNAP